MTTQESHLIKYTLLFKFLYKSHTTTSHSEVYQLLFKIKLHISHALHYTVSRLHHLEIYGKP